MISPPLANDERYISDVTVKWGDFEDRQAVLWEQGGLEVYWRDSEGSNWKINRQIPDTEVLESLRRARGVIDRMISQLT